jgi:hypothetical protein
MKILKTFKMKHDSNNAITALSIVILKIPDYTDRTANIIHENQFVKINTDPTDSLLNDFKRATLQITCYLHNCSRPT